MGKKDYIQRFFEKAILTKENSIFSYSFLTGGAKF